MTHRLALALCGLVVFCAGTAHATILVDFDTIPGIVAMPSGYYPDPVGPVVPSDARLSDQLQPSTGATFSSDSMFVAVVDFTTSANPAAAISDPNGIGGVTSAGELSYAHDIFVTFSDPSNPLVPAVTDFVSIRGDQAPDTGASATMDAFDLDGGLLGSVTASDIASGLTLSLSLPGIHSIRVSETPGSMGMASIGFDNLEFNEVSPVPEPAALAIWIVLGTCCIGYGWRRRKAA